MVKKRIIVPPVYFICGAILIILTRFVYPIGVFKPDTILIVIGIIFLLIGLPIGFSSLYLFKKNKTTLNPNDKSNYLVIRGPYKLTRNPMYLSMTLNLIGISLLLGSISSIVITIILVAILHFKIIPVEEKIMADTFGKPYLEYCKRVQRWI